MTEGVFTPPARRGLTPLELVTIALLLVAFAVRLWLALSLDLDGDEAYYAFWSAWPSLAYLDHPPGVAISIWAGEAIFGTSVFGVRAFALFAQFVVAAALWRTARLLVPGRSAAAIAVILYSLSLTAAISFVATPDAPSLLFWTLSVWAAAEAGKRPLWWLAAGLFAGLGLASKYTNAWLGIGLVAYLLLSREGRRQLLGWPVWAGGLVALIAFSPILWWQATHEWRSFLFQGVRLVTFETRFGALLAEFLLSQAVLVGPILMAASMLGAGVYLIGRSGKASARLALPVLTSLPLLLYFLFHSLHARVEANWPQPVLPMMTLIAAWLIAGIRWPIVRTGLVVAHSLLGAALIGLLCWQAVFKPFDFGVYDRTRMLRDWRQLAADVRAVADAQGAQAILTDGNYRMSGELFFYGRAGGDPRPVRSIASPERYDYIPPAERFPRRFPALFVRQGSTPPDDYFGHVEKIGTVDRGTGRDPETYTLFIVSEPTAAFPTAAD